MDLEYFKQEKDLGKTLYQIVKAIYNPYFKKNISLSARGFHHLEFTGNKKRPENEQLFKFRFLELGIEIIKNSSTIQEYRKDIQSRTGKNIEYWGMVAIIGENSLKIRVVLRRVGKGKITFWSVMPYSRIHKDRQKIYDTGLEED